MTTLQKIIILFLSLNLLACQTQPRMDTPVDTAVSVSKAPVSEPTSESPKFGQVRKVSRKYIDEWVADNKFTKALDSLESVPASGRSEEDTKLINKIKGLADVYDKTQAELIEQLYKKGDRQAAVELLYESFTNYSDGSRLWFVKEKINKGQSNYVQEIESQLLLAKAEWVLQSTPLFKELSKFRPDDKQLIAEAKKAAEETAKIVERLTTLGIHALSANEFDLAEQRLTMANTLNPTSENITALDRLDHLRLLEKRKRRDISRAEEEKKRKTESRNRVQVQRKEQARAEIESTRFVEQISQYLAKKQLHAARTHFNKFKKLHRNHPDIQRFQRLISRAIKKKVDSLFVEGSELYSNGQIEKAKGLWEYALRLDPNNVKVKSRIKRAEQVLSKLRELQKKEPN